MRTLTKSNGFRRSDKTANPWRRAAGWVVCFTVAVGGGGGGWAAPPPSAGQSRRASDTSKVDGYITSDELEAWRILNAGAEKSAPPAPRGAPPAQPVARRPATAEPVGPRTFAPEPDPIAPEPGPFAPEPGPIAPEPVPSRPNQFPSHPNQVRESRGYLAQRRRRPYLPLGNGKAPQARDIAQNARARPDPIGAERPQIEGGDPAGHDAMHAPVLRVGHLGLAPPDQPPSLPLEGPPASPDQDLPLPPEGPPPPPEEVPAETGGPASAMEAPPAGSALPEPDSYQVIDLVAAWRLALVANPHLAGAREALNEALALRRGANAIFLPNLNAGFMYHLHNGALQASFGQIRQLNENSLYVGGGSRTLAAETLAVPAIQFFHPLGDLVFEPLAARQQVVIRRFDTNATANSVLLDTSLLYLELVSAETRLEAIRQTEIEFYGVARVVRAYADAGQGRVADAIRAHVEALLVHTEVQRSEERVAVASANLAQVLNLDPNVRLRTEPAPLAAMQIVDPTVPLATLVQEARGRHPLLASKNAAVDVAGTRLRQEQTRPFLPLVMVGMSAGGFGGTGNFPPQSQFMQLPFTNLQNRADFDVWSVWTLQNLGFGNVATIRQRRAVLNQSLGESARAMNEVRDQVAESYAQAQAQMQKIRVARRQLDDAEDGYKKERLRLEAAQVEHPIEVNNTVELLASARQDLIQAIIGYNQAEFRLFVATGQSPMVAAPVVEQPAPGVEVLGPGQKSEEARPPAPAARQP